LKSRNQMEESWAVLEPARRRRDEEEREGDMRDEG
jgi:hypothetical protein